jgi:hypothetical protein
MAIQTKMLPLSSIIILLLFAGCSKKEMPAIQARVNVLTSSSPKQVTWTQGDSIFDGTYNIFKTGTRQSLDAPGGVSALLLNKFTGSDQQKWDISNTGNGYFKITNTGNGKSLSITTNSGNTQLQQVAFTGDDSQLWNIEHQGHGLYKITNKAGGLALTIGETSGASGPAIKPAAYNALSTQQFAIMLDAYNDAVTDSVVVDLGTQTGPMNHVASGFLHGFAADGTPADSLITPLKINTVRDWTFSMNTIGPRLNAMGVKQQVVLSDEWSQPYGANPPGPPGNNGSWTAWQNTVANTVNYARGLANPANLEYDIWNEPDGGGFWSYTGQYSFPNGFFQAWKYAYQQIRSIDPNAVIVGPSYQNYDLANLKLFISFCKANNVMPNYLSWHFPANVVQEVAQMKQILADSAVTNVSGFQINEYLGSSLQYAGENAYLITQLERAGVNAAMHAIWTSDNDYLDGIITNEANGNKKNATWWVYKAYGDITGNILSTTGGSYVDLVAGLNNSPRVLNILLGTKPGLPQGNVKVKFINLSPQVTNNNGTVHIRLQHIPDVAGGSLCASPEIVMDKDVVVTYGNSMQLIINWNSIYDAFEFSAY